MKRSIELLLLTAIFACFCCLSSVQGADADDPLVVTLTNPSSGDIGGHLSTSQTGPSVSQEEGVHHFRWSAIGSPKYSGVPFQVTITAEDIMGRTVTTFTGTAALSAIQEHPLHPIAISPTTTGAFVNGVWTSQVTVASPGTNVVLSADAGMGTRGPSDPFDVVDPLVVSDTSFEPAGPWGGPFDNGFATYILTNHSDAPWTGVPCQVPVGSQCGKPAARSRPGQPLRYMSITPMSLPVP